MLTSKEDVKAALLKWIAAKDTLGYLLLQENFTGDEDGKTYPLYVDDSMGAGCAAYWTPETGLMVSTDDDFVSVTSEEQLMAMPPFGEE